MPKLVLYMFEGSVWASASLLAIEELGYTAEQIEMKSINIPQGENFNPSFLKVNPNATIPTLVAPENIYTSTIDVVHYLVEHAPRPAAASSSSQDLITKVHADAIDPNFCMMSARSDAELKAKAANGAAAFVRSRQATLSQLLSTAPEHKAFYEDKLAGTSFLASLYDGTAPAPAVQGFFAKSRAHWAAVARFVLVELPRCLPRAAPGFVGGEKPGEEDFHVAAWLARVVGLAGGTPDAAGLLKLEGELGGEEVPEAVRAYWGLWIERESWKALYKQGLH